MVNKFGENVTNATRWNTMSQIIIKLLSPLSNLIVAHILAPEIFGVVTSITLIISFIDVFTEAGFQKYIVQHELKKNEDFDKIVNVAFITNLAISLLFFLTIIIFRTNLSILVGAPGKELALIITACTLPMTSFSTIQHAIYQRKLNFRPLFFIYLIGTIIPLIVTIPLALLGFSYWSIIIGKLCSSLYIAIALTIKSSWKPRLWYNMTYLKSMYKFCCWSMCESIMLWLSSNADIFLIATILDSYYVGIYKTSMSTVNMLLRVVSSSLLPVTYSVISRLQNDKKKFVDTCYDMQRLLVTIVLPMGVGILVYRDFATLIALGSKWYEASFFLGLWSLSTSIVISYHYICDDIYRAIGKPKLSFISHFITFFCTAFVVLIFSRHNFESLIIARCAVSIVIIIVDCFLLKKNSGVSMLCFFKNSLSSILSSLCMVLVALLMQQINNNIFWNIFSIFISAVIYFFVLYFLPSGKQTIKDIVRFICPKSLYYKFNL